MKNLYQIILTVFIFFTFLFWGCTYPIESKSILAIKRSDSNNSFHNHIHNFYINQEDKNKPNYLVNEQHASAMSYAAVTHHLVKNLPGELDNLERILLHNAYYSPISEINFNSHTAKYSASYLDANNNSAINKSRKVWVTYPMDNSDIEILQGFVCAKVSNYTSISPNSTANDLDELFFKDKEYNRLIANWQSKYVVEELAKDTILSLETGQYDYVFMDDVVRNPKISCENKEYGGKGSYATWKDGQLAFLQKVTNAAHNMVGRKGGQIKIFGNIWSPYADYISPKWYASNQLRLDHYYIESGGSDPADLLQGGQQANGKDPETGLPAFAPLGGGYIPANLFSVSTVLRDMYKLVAMEPFDPKMYDDYLIEHYLAAGIAGKQGSWFGWYGEMSVTKANNQGRLIHNNAMQLLRVIPNWENIANVPLQSRSFDQNTYVYNSPRNYFSRNVIKGWNPINNEIYLVFNNMKEGLNLKDKQINSAYFVDDFFNKTNNSAMSCLNKQNQTITFTCSTDIGRGIRLTIQ